MSSNPKRKLSLGRRNLLSNTVHESVWSRRMTEAYKTDIILYIKYTSVENKTDLWVLGSAAILN